MVPLPLANVLHYKVRSLLSALGIGIGICMLVTLSGLARGSLDEVADRWEAVDAELIVYPRGWGENVTTLSGIGLSDRYREIIRQRYDRLVQDVVPVFFWQVRLAGQDHLAAGVDSSQWHRLAGNRKLADGRLFDPNGRFSRWLEGVFSAPGEADDEIVELTEWDLSHPEHNGLEVVIDTRLAKTGPLRRDQTIAFAEHRWKIVGIVPAGGLARIYMPRRTAQYLFGSGSISKSTLMFVKLRDGVPADSAARQIRGIGQEVVQVRQYRGMLERTFGIMFRYVDAVNALALVIAFLFIMITLYMMVLQRTREIAILKSSGASKRFILRQVLGESALLTGTGTILGIALSFVAAWLIESARPLLTVTITWPWIAVAVGVAAVGAVASALYPAWRATRVDMVEALTLE